MEEVNTGGLKRIVYPKGHKFKKLTKKQKKELEEAQKKAKKREEEEDLELEQILKRSKRKHRMKINSISTIVLIILLLLIITVSDIIESSKLELSENYNIAPTNNDGLQTNLNNSESYKHIKYSELEKWKMPIHYFIDVGDTSQEMREQKIKNFQRAIKVLTTEIPSISFVEVNSSNEAEMIFAIQLPREHWEIAGEDPFMMTIGLMVPDEDPDTRILAYVYDTPNNRCRDSQTALHELLHAFGIGHSQYDYGSLMSPNSGGCGESSPIEPENIEFLNKIYK
ncbi:hypothetical protein COU60_01510 [Candidatus Pacearchaeota archaeon CG10_big_fil_rev_8_21_14_0_10_34_76]|nr:MAG: hypothetical protein COU60_01510 [Candidatus Pacearchaeota archaeon CG10_big_fil_rev_8_21_14_0_10_34_76]